MPVQTEYKYLEPHPGSNYRQLGPGILLFAQNATHERNPSLFAKDGILILMIGVAMFLLFSGIR